MNNVQTTASHNVETRAGSSDLTRLTFNSDSNPTKLNKDNNQSTTAQLHVVKTQEAPVVKTIAQAHEESTLSTKSLMSVVRSTLSLASAGLSAAAMGAVTILPKESGMRKFIETWASFLARVSIGIVSGVTGAVDAIQSGKPGLAIAQVGDVVTSLIAPIKDMTNYRGLSIGMYNALPALETMHGKVQYDGISDYLKTNWGACKQMLSNMKSNPLILFDPSQKGAIGFWSGAAMSVMSLLYMLTGAKIFATARNALGISVEAEKAKPLHLREGRGRYAASGYLMMGGSAANIASQYTKSGSEFWSYANLLLNALGKERFNAALQANEPAKIGAPITFGQMVTNTVKSMFSFGREAEKVLEKAQPSILKLEDQSAAVQAEVKAMQNSQAQSQGYRSISSLGSSARSFAPVRAVSVAPAAKTESSAAASAPVSVPVPVVAAAPVTATAPTQGRPSLSKPLSKSLSTTYQAIPTQGHSSIPQVPSSISRVTKKTA